MADGGFFVGRTALVTGGASGIGRAVCEQLLEKGANLVVWDLNAQRLDELRAMAPDRVETAVVDVSDSKAVDAATQAARARFGGLDLLLNNAGIIGQHMSVTDFNEAELDRVLAVNLKSAFIVAHAFIQAQTDKPGRAIVNLSSIAARTGGMVGNIAYATTKGALRSFTIALAKELAPEVRVNAMAPGVIDTEIQKDVFKDPANIQAMSNLIPMKRLGTAKEVADCAVWLLSDAATYVTGVIVDVSGGR
ncbi:oxidoreductase [Bordetella genomosp. 10]|uniref:Oxidoreductase n=1 Tax=Bordetella genomosp. 10 TaxID=1416804 RepID=A0A261SN29_9BORD|nr:SDR family NAD(P)-dependent oxidoreductase [Bordetella genomosp. 10]OZI38407.1 oxidoreductase [Bordetella genomosp. 10]